MNYNGCFREFVPLIKQLHAKSKSLPQISEGCSTLARTAAGPRVTECTHGFGWPYIYPGTENVRYILRREGLHPPPAVPLTHPEKVARTRRVVSLRAAGKTYREIGEEMGFSPARGHQLMRRHERDIARTDNRGVR